MPKLCIGRSYCHTELFGSKAVHTGSYEKATMKSIMKRMTTAPMIWVGDEVRS